VEAMAISEPACEKIVLMLLATPGITAPAATLSGGPPRVTVKDPARLVNQLVLET